MSVKFPLLSILSTALLLFFALQGDPPQLHSWEVGINVLPGEVRVVVDPTWVVWTAADIAQIQGHSGICVGNVVAIPAEFYNTQLGDLLLWHETNHVSQNRAFGLLALPLSLFLNIEGKPFYDDGSAGDLSWLQHCNNSMWLPPPDWVDQWHFLTIVADKSF